MRDKCEVHGWNLVKQYDCAVKQVCHAANYLDTAWNNSSFSLHQLCGLVNGGQHARAQYTVGQESKVFQ